MPDNSGTKIPMRVLVFMGTVMFLFGGTAGYIVRDVRADAQVLRVTDDARENAQALATEVLRRGALVAGTLTSGVRAAAESTAAAVDHLTEKPHQAGKGDSATSAAPTASALSSEGENPAPERKPARPKR